MSFPATLQPHEPFPLTSTAATVSLGAACRAQGARSFLRQQHWRKVVLSPLPPPPPVTSSSPAILSSRVCQDGLGLLAQQLCLTEASMFPCSSDVTLPEGNAQLQACWEAGITSLLHSPSAKDFMEVLSLPLAGTLVRSICVS